MRNTLLMGETKIYFPLFRFSTNTYTYKKKKSKMLINPPKTHPRSMCI